MNIGISEEKSSGKTAKPTYFSQVLPGPRSTGPCSGGEQELAATHQVGSKADHQCLSQGPLWRRFDEDWGPFDGEIVKHSRNQIDSCTLVHVHMNEHFQCPAYGIFCVCAWQLMQVGLGPKQHLEEEHVQQVPCLGFAHSFADEIDLTSHGITSFC